MKKIIVLSVLSILILIQGCAAVNVRTDNQPEDQSPPSFQKTYTYWFWGLRGKHLVNVREICVARPVEQMQTVDTFTDSFLHIITGGIYWPRTARVWCGEIKQ